MLSTLVTYLLSRASPDRRHRLRQRLRRLRHPALLGTLRRTSPLSGTWGFDRGTPVDRYYIQEFLESHRADIWGRVLEVQDSAYTERFGVGVTRRDVVDIDAENPKATMVADLAAADSIPSDSFDCFILTQTLQLIYDTPAVLRHAHRLLRSGGVLLVTVPALSRIPRHLLHTDHWRFTTASCAALFGEAFGPEQVTVRAYGNVLAGIGFLAGLAHEELTARELDVQDDFFPLVITVRAVKG